MNLSKAEKTFIKKLLTAYFSIQGVLFIVGLAVFIYFANGFYKQWKEQDFQHKAAMIASVSSDSPFNKRFEKHQQDIEDIMKEHSAGMKERHDKFIEEFDKTMKPHEKKEL